jgi:translocation and assembly module TamB
LLEQSLRISGFHLEAADSSITLDGSGDVDLESGTLAAEMAWQGLAWPVGTALPDIRSRAGRILLSGTLDDWNLAGDAELDGAGLPPGTLHVEASGNRDHARITIVDGRILGGTLSGDAKYDWSGNGRWSARLRAENIQTQGLHSTLPGMVNADLTALGELEPFSLDLDIRTLEGEIRNQRIDAGGRVQVREESLEFTNLLMSSADSTLALHGNISSAVGVEFSANIVDLGTVLAHSSGSLQADGRISLQAGNPRLLLNLEGREMSWEDIRLQQVSIHDSANSAADAIADLHLEAENLQFGGEAMDKISLDLDIAQSIQAIRLAAQKSGLELSANLNGSLRRHGSALHDSEWVGQLNSLTLGESGQVALSLNQPALVELSANNAAIKTACIGAGTDSRLCLDAWWERDSSFSTALKLKQIPLDLIQSLLDTDLELTQYAEGEFRWEARSNKSPSGHAMIHLSPGEVRYAGDTDALFKTGEGLIGFELDDGRLSAGNFDVPLPGLGGIDLDFSVSDVASGLDADLGGRLRMELADLEILTMFLPMLDHAEGQFDADLALSGSAGHPYFSGSLSLANGRIYHEASGLSLSDIQLSGQVIGNDETQMNGSFRALEGTGSLQASVDLSDILSPRVALRLEGKNLTLLDAPTLKVVAEPDIQLNWQDGMMDINGSLLIPSAHIAPDVIPESTVSESPDLEIVAGEVPASLAEGKAKPDVAIRGNLEVILGDEVDLDLFVAVAEVNGSVNFTWQDDLLPLANGNYSLVGQIQAFGQSLQITEGNIGFPGVPANNPHLNIRAERQIFGNSEIRRAGVYVTGTLNRPVVEPYTDPMTNHERAQTLLITGSDFNMERGVGAVNIGTYIAPRVFVSYGIGVFEDENVISIRYDLGRNWGIKATSGQRQTGLDISYTIEH